MVHGGYRQEATAFLPQPIERVGKRGLDRNSEDPVNEDGEEILSSSWRRVTNLRDNFLPVIARLRPGDPVFQRRRRLNDGTRRTGCPAFAGHDSFHNNTARNDGRPYAWLATFLPSAACAAARRAIGTR